MAPTINFELRQGDEGGVTVELDIPFREGDAVAPAPVDETPEGPTIVAPEFDDPATWRTGEYSTLVLPLVERAGGPAGDARGRRRVDGAAVASERELPAAAS